MKRLDPNTPESTFPSLPDWMKEFPAALVKVRELAQQSSLTLEVVAKCAEPFGLHRGATFVEFVGYVERELGVDVANR